MSAFVTTEILAWPLVFGSIGLVAWSAAGADGGAGECALATLAFLTIVPALLAVQMLQRRPRQTPADSPRKPAPEDQLHNERAKADASASLFAQLSDFALVHPRAKLDEATCHRFLRARKGNVDAAASGIRKYLEWHEEARPSDITANDVKEELATGKGYVHGQDRRGRSIVWAFARRHDKSTRDADATIKLILYNLETAIKTGEERGTEQICLMFDLSGFGTKSMDYEVVRRLFQLLADYYPERLGQILLLNAPAIFSIFWRVVRPYIDPNTFEKIQFASRDALCNFVDPVMLPREVADMLECAA